MKGIKELNEIVEYYKNRPIDEMYELDFILPEMVRNGEIENEKDAREYIKEKISA